MPDLIVTKNDDGSETHARLQRVALVAPGGWWIDLQQHRDYDITEAGVAPRFPMPKDWALHFTMQTRLKAPQQPPLAKRVRP